MTQHVHDQTETPWHQLTLVKRTRQWVFRYQQGQEEAVLRSMAQAANDPRYEFDWFDAAVLGQQVGDRIGHKLKDLMDD